MTLLDLLFSGTEGFVAVQAFRRGGDGRPAWTTYFPTDNRDEIPVAAQRELDLADSGGTPLDIYFCPHPRDGKQRAKAGGSTSLHVLHADLDKPTVDPDLLDRINPYRVRSGSSGCLHVYVPLSRAVPEGRWAALETALIRKLGADQSKQANNDLLRIPGTVNTKSDPPAPVEVDHDQPTTWDPEELAELLGVDVDAEETVRLNTKAKLTREELQAHLDKWATDGEPGGEVPGILSKALRGIAEKERGSDTADPRHKVMCATQIALLRRGVNGDPGVKRALDQLRDRFTQSLRDHPNGPARDPYTEWLEALAGAVGIVAEDPEPDEEVPEAFAFDLEELAGLTPAVNLPAEWFDRHPTLARIRKAALSGGRSPDAVLGAVLARHSARIPRQLNVATGIGNGRLSMNLFTALIGGPASGKSSSHDIAEELVPLEGNIVEAPGLASGEAIAELFMGEVDDLDRPGKTKRGVARWHAYAFVDEGETLIRQGQRNANTTLSVLRSAWVGQRIGTQNATADRTRIVPAKDYHLGMTIGFQPDRLDDLLDDAGGGTPQRLLYLSATSPDIPDEDNDSFDLAQAPLDYTAPGLAATRVELPERVVKELRLEDRRRTRGEVQADEYEAHAGMLRAKLAGLLATLCGSTTVDDDMWDAAVELADLSQRNLRRLVQAQATRRRKAEDARHRTRVEQEVDLDAAREAGQVERVTERIVSRLTAKGPSSRSAVRRFISEPHRKYFEEALERAVDEGRVDQDGSLLKVHK